MPHGLKKTKTKLLLILVRGLTFYREIKNYHLVKLHNKIYLCIFGTTLNLNSVAEVRVAWMC